jgi:hypothetical protein
MVPFCVHNEVYLFSLKFDYYCLLYLLIHLFCLSRAVLGSTDIKSLLKQPIPPPASTDPDQYVCFEGYWVPQGKLEPYVDAKVKFVFVFRESSQICITLLTKYLFQRKFPTADIC